VNLIQKSSTILILFAAALALALAPQQSISRTSDSATRPPAAEETPAYHVGPPEGALPATMTPDNFSDPIIQNAYTVAAGIKKVLYQQPCYCHCDKSVGHTALLDCFTSVHGSGCGVCLREDLYSYEQTRKGKTPAQIRDGIIAGEWQKVDVTKYKTPLPTTPPAHKASGR
jgi:Protein of unknown function with PCYCGC motif